TSEARSEGVGHGGEFIWRLPVVVATVERPAPAAELGPRGPTLRILVADDNQDAAESLVMVLQLEGHDVHSVFDGDAAIAAIEELRPDVALVDIGMPGANGYEVARRVREHPWGEQVHLVALTGWGQPADRRPPEDPGFDAPLV